MNSFLKQDIKFLPGVGPKRAEILNRELKLFCNSDLLRYYPYKYIDRSKVYSIREINTTIAGIQLRGRVVSFKKEGEKPKERLVAKFVDETGTVDLVFFRGIKYILDHIRPNVEYMLFGKPTVFNNQINFVHPELEEAAKFDTAVSYAMQPVYNTSEKMKTNFINSKGIQNIIATLWHTVRERIIDNLPEYLVKRANLLPLHESLFNIHFPQSLELLHKSQFRLKFEELFFIQLDLLFQKNSRLMNANGLVFQTAGDYLNTFYNQKLPFPLTDAQKRVVKEIRVDLGSGRQMNRLLQGDVGSGKTLVALMTMLMAAGNGYQSCLMVPTEILANQHFTSISKHIEGLGLNIYLLTGSTTKKARGKIHEGLLEGTIHILIGTHALLEDIVQFNNLGLVIIDEQHRFGVAQRAKLWNKNVHPPHILVMTATPIPRTLAMTVYSDLDISVIDQLPPGRKPIITTHCFDSKRVAMFGFIRKQIEAGRQVYVVYPLIKESETLDLKHLEDGYESFSRDFPSPKYCIAVVHGKMKNEEKDYSMRLFASGQAQIMIATTVIEVGVDVPNATVMVIENAERFGLSQLHQLRGRVGRGKEQSYCILTTSYKLSVESRKRIEAMCNSNDGFELSELDLKLRGPGDIDGTQQSGVAFDLKIADIARDGQILQYARDLVIEILTDDPKLEKQENIVLRNYLMENKSTAYNWSVIS